MRNRTEYVAINMSFSLIGQAITMILNFISRTIFINTLGAQYLGVNGLFTNILTILSFAELGIGNAIIFHLYKPLAHKDEQETIKYMKIYEKVYRIIGIFVIIIGLIMIPFIKYIVNEQPDIQEDIRIIYLMFLINTSISYFYIYKTNIIKADQKEYIITFYTQIIKIISIIIKSVVLYITKSFMIYLTLDILTTILTNFILSKKAEKMYPCIKKTKNIEIDKKSLKNIINDTKALMIYKVATVILNGTDNIIISIIFGVSMVGYTSNYILVISALTTIVSQLINNFVSSVGNLNTENNAKKSKDVFNKILFITYWIYSFISIMLLIMMQDFINNWIGANYLLPYGVIIGLTLDFYIKGIINTCVIYRTTNGLFNETRYSALAAAIINIILSVVLAKIIGVAGIFLATGISRFITMGIRDAIVVYKRIFNISSKEYFVMLTKQFILITIIFGIFTLIFGKILNEGWINIILKAIIVALMYNVIFIIIYRNKKEFKDILEIMKLLINKIKNKLIKKIA